MFDSGDGRRTAQTKARAVRRVGILIGLVPLAEMTADDLAEAFAYRIQMADGLAAGKAAVRGGRVHPFDMAENEVVEMIADRNGDVGSDPATHGTGPA